MKKVIYYLLFAALLIFPLNALAQTYSMKDLNISVDDSTWYVFTRDNILNNSKLDELEITYDYINTFMNTNDVYLDSCKFDINDSSNTIELFVVIKKVDSNKNLHTYSDNQIKELGEQLKNKTGAKSFDIYSVNKYKYVHVKYLDSSTSYSIDEYYTIVNGYGYTIMAQKENSFSDLETAEIKSIVNTTTFKYNMNYENNSSNNDIWQKALVGFITAIIVGGLSILFNKSKKKIESIDESKNGESKQINENSKPEIIICEKCGCKVLKEMKKCPKCNNKMKG